MCVGVCVYVCVCETDLVKHNEKEETDLVKREKKKKKKLQGMSFLFKKRTKKEG